MEESTKPNNSKSEATTKKTLKDIEGSEKDDGAETDDTTGVPSPDGQPRDEREKEKSGPM